MATLQIRNLPDDLYQALVRKAEAERRTLSQQAIVELSRNFESVAERKARRRRALTQISKLHLGYGKKSLDPVKLIREDRDR